MSERLRLTIAYEEPDEDGWIVARVGQVPGAISQGRTPEEARENEGRTGPDTVWVKLRDLERHLTAHGARKVAEGGKHTKWRSADAARATAVPRHSEDGARPPPGDLPASSAFRRLELAVGPLCPQGDEAGGGEVCVERQRFPDSKHAHQREARCVDERILALGALNQPAHRLLLELASDELNPNASGRRQTVDESDGDAMTRALAQKRPCLPAHVVRRYERRACELFRQSLRVAVPPSA